MPAIAGLLVAAGAQGGPPAALAYAAGPGMFTGVRLGCSVAQGLALAWSCTVVEVCSLACAIPGQAGTRFWVVNDARMGEVFAAAFVSGAEGLETVIPAGCYAPDAVPVPDGEGWIGLGSGFAVFGSVLAGRAGAALVETRPDVVGDAQGVAALAVQGLARGQGRAPEQLGPQYVRNKVAQTVAERLAAGGRA